MRWVAGSLLASFPASTVWLGEVLADCSGLVGLKANGAVTGYGTLFSILLINWSGRQCMSINMIYFTQTLSELNNKDRELLGGVICDFVRWEFH